MTENKRALINSASEKTGLSKAETADAVTAFLDSIKESLAKGDKVQIAGFGTLEIKETAERTGRNPQTGEKMTIPASKRVHFRPAKELKDAVVNS